MSEITVHRDIAASLDAVFDAATDFESAARVVRGIESIEMLTPGPIGVGTRFRETRLMFKRPATEEMEVVEFSRPTRYALGCENHGCRYRTDFELERIDGGTRLSMRFKAEPLTAFAKVMGFVFRGMTKSMMEHCARDLDDLKKSIETREGSARPTEAT